jgi:hypothetical protein
MKTFKSWLSESPARAQKIGKGWNDLRNNNYYDGSSVKFLNSEHGLERIESKFNKTDFKFRLFFLKQKGAAYYNERGEVTKEELKELMNIDLTQENIQDDEITIIFTGNKAAEKVPLTPWTIAHRIGHTVRREKGFLYNKNNEWDYMVHEFTTALVAFINFAYDKDFYSHKFKFTDIYPARAIVNMLGTMRSARMNKINRPYEFLFELFAQYIIDGGVKLNREIPNKFRVGKEVWTLDYSPYGIDVDLQYMEELLDNSFSRILDKAQGKIFIM